MLSLTRSKAVLNENVGNLLFICGNLIASSVPRDLPPFLVHTIQIVMYAHHQVFHVRTRNTHKIFILKIGNRDTIHKIG